LTPPLLDTSVLIRHFTNDHRDLSPRATALVQRVIEGDIVVRLTDPVVFETAFTLERTYRVPKVAVRDALLELIQSANVNLPDKERWAEALELHASSPLSIVDAWHVVLMRQSGIGEIYAFDQDFDRIPGITRIEP
jgi:predicted nucleic acid-binding protein